MAISVTTQASIFLYSVLGGMLIAFIYDAFRIKRKAVKTGTLATYIEDFIYWVIVAMVMFTVVYYSNEGEIRGFIFIGTVIGVILYISLLSSIIVKSVMLILKILYKLLRAVYLVLSYPFRLVCRILRVPCGYAAVGCRNAFRSVRRMGKTRLAKAAIGSKIFKNFRKKL